MQVIELVGFEEAKKLFGTEKFEKAQGRAIKKALDKSYTKLSFQITGKWAIKKKDLKPALHKRMAYGRNPTGYLTARSKPLTWRFFGAKQNRKGVSVKILRGGSRKTWLDSFGVQKPGGTVFFTKTGDRYVRRRDVRSDARTKKTYIRPRLPITKQAVITVASMFDQSNAYNPTVKVAGDTWQKEFIRQLSL